MQNEFIEWVKAAAAVGAVVAAFLGLQTWRRQLYGTSEYDRARRLFRSVLEIRDTIANLRSPYISGGETDSAFVAAGIVPEHERVKQDPRFFGVVYQQRWKPVANAYSDFLVELLDSEVLWGASVRIPAQKINKCLNELFSAIDFHMQYSEEDSMHDEGLKSLRIQNLKVLFRRGSESEPDAVSSSVNEFVHDFELIVRPHLRR